jgi:hypothetical protein
MMRSRWRGDALADLLCTAIDSVSPVASPVLGESCAGRGGRTHLRLRMFGKRVNLVVAHCTLEVLCLSRHGPHGYTSLQSCRYPVSVVVRIVAPRMIDSTCTSQARYQLIAGRDLPADMSRHYVLHG